MAEVVGDAVVGDAVVGDAAGGDDAGADGGVVLERGAVELTVDPDCDAPVCEVLVPPPSHAASAATAQTMNAVLTNR